MDLKHLLNQTTFDKKINGDEHDSKENEINDGVNDELNDGVNDEVNDEVNDGVNDEVNVDEDEVNVDEINCRFQLPWNKLEKGQKLNRILLFIKQETEEKSLPDVLAKELKSMLFNACDRGLFNKVSDVSYNSETGLIESFKCLEFNETSKKYKLKTKGSKNRSVSKSRSNIDRLVKKK